MADMEKASDDWVGRKHSNTLMEEMNWEHGCGSALNEAKGVL